MFSGIVQQLGAVEQIETRGPDSAVLDVSAELYAEATETRPKIGDSIAHNGVCLTLAEYPESQTMASSASACGIARFDLSSETLRATNLGALSRGSSVHLEKSRTFKDTIDGHLVSGHVDGLAELCDIRLEQDTRRLEFSVSAALAPFLAEKGSVAIDGVSLTVGEVKDEAECSRFSVYLIPHTWSATRFKEMELAEKSNIEVDLLARYASRALRYERAFSSRDRAV